MRERIIRRIGSSYYARLAPVDMQDLNLKEGGKIGIMKIPKKNDVGDNK